MSHAQGTVYRPSGECVGYFEYDGTRDVACTAITPDRDTLSENWRSDANERDCTCGQPSVPVVLYSSYGGGFHWPATACLRCGAIVSGITFEEPTDGHPFGEGEA